MAYGFEAYKPDGSPLVSSTDGVARLIAGVTIGAQYSGTFSLPNFNSDVGFWTVQPYLRRWRRLGGVWYDVPKNGSWNLGGVVAGLLCGHRNPILVWDNATKIMTVTANTESTGGTGGAVLNSNPDYRLQFIHYR